jgi:glycosyltransferase involved in cell wall biosynthesis
MKRKALIIVENMPVPFDTRVWKEALSLRENQYEVTVLCPRTKSHKRGHEVIAGIRIYRHPMAKEADSAPRYLFEYAIALFWETLYAWWIYLRHGFHVIQGCNPPDDLFLVALPFKLLGVKYIFDHHDANPELYLSKYAKKGVFYSALVWLEKLTYRFSDIVMATNSSYRELALARGGVDSQDVFIVRNGPDLKSFNPLPSNQALKHGKRYLVGYVGTMSIQEGLDILLDVAAHIRNLGRCDIHFTCIGGGPGLAGLRKLTQEKDLENMVNFTGRIPDEQLLEILSTADVCVNPDKPCAMNDISTMIKIMEYMALGRPIVQFDLKEGRFSAQEASLYADNGNRVTDFADKILWLLEHPDERKRMGACGRRRVEKELAWEYSSRNLLAAYDRAFSKRGALSRPRRDDKPAEVIMRSVSQAPKSASGTLLQTHEPMDVGHTEIRIRGKEVSVPSAQIGGRRVITTGKWLSVASVHDEQLVEGDPVADPQSFVLRLKEAGLKADIFTFTQKLPDAAPKHTYHLEWDNFAVIPITTFSDWWENRVEPSVRRAVRKAAKTGVVVRLADLDDEFVKGIAAINNETPVRQGRDFWHFQKSLEAVKRENSTYSERNIFLGAYHQGELVGYMRMTCTDGVASVIQLLSMIKHSDKRPTNALIAKAIEVCERMGFSHLVYCNYIYNDPNSSLTEFKRRNAFEQVLLPRYYIPLTVKGEIAVRLGLHRGLKKRIPKLLTTRLLKIRNSWYERKAAEGAL